MEQVFSIGHQIWSFFQTLMSPEQYPEWIQNGWPIGLGILAFLSFLFIFKGRRQKIDRRQRLEALEEALLDDDIEAKSLELPEVPEEVDLYEEYPDDDDYPGLIEENAVPEPSGGTLARDPEFGGQIVISADSSRKSAPEPEMESTIEEVSASAQVDSIADIDEEFAQFAQELKDKAKEVQRRHQIEDDLMEEELFEEDLATEQSTGPIALSAVDILPDEDDETSNDWNQELEGLLEQPGSVEDKDLFDSLYEKERTSERAPLEIKERNEQLIRNLEEFQKDFEHRFQSLTLSELAQKNYELVESLSDSEQAQEYQAMKRNQMESLSSLESMVFGTVKKKR